MRQPIHKKKFIIIIYLQYGPQIIHQRVWVHQISKSFHPIARVPHPEGRAGELKQTEGRCYRRFGNVCWVVALLQIYFGEVGASGGPFRKFQQARSPFS